MTSAISVWSSYRPSDFLLFSAQTYHRLFELYNTDMWPAACAAAAVAAALLWMAARAATTAKPWAWMLLAVCWAWVAWAFHLQRYASINWAAPWFAAAFGLQGLLLLASAFVGWQGAHGARRVLGLSLLAFAVLVQPWLGLVLRGGSWSEAELFGMAPDPTALGTVGWLLLLRPAPGMRVGALLSWALWPVPLLWCVIGGLTQWTLASQG